MFGTRRKESCDCDDLQSRIDHLEQERRDREEREERDRERQKRERQEAYNEAMRTADDWPEAFRKQRTLIGGEVRFVQTEIAAITNDKRLDEAERAKWLADWQRDLDGLLADLRAIDVAEKAWLDEIRKVDEQIESLKAGVRANVAAAVQATLTDGRRYDFAGELIRHLESDDPSGWLNW